MSHLRHLWNHFLSERSYHSRRAVVLNRPTIFCIETTSICNLKCVMCPYKDMTRPNQMMDFEIFRKAVDEVHAYNGPIWLHHLGEPLAHPECFEQIRYAKSRGLECGISTNATLLNETRAAKLLESGLDRVILSMDGVTKETYERLREPANFEKVVGNIEAFLRRKREGGFRAPHTVVQLIYMKETEDQVQEFKRRWGPLADEVHIKMFSTWAEQVERITELSEAKHRYNPDHTLSDARHPCSYLWRNLVVLANGDVTPCCVDYDARMVMGNVREQTLAQIWNGERFVRTRRDHLAGRYTDTCATCREWQGGPAQPAYPLGGGLWRELKVRWRQP